MKPTVKYSFLERDFNRLKLSGDAKNVLKRIAKAAGADNTAMKESVKDLFVIAPVGAGLTDYARAYEQILIRNEVYRTKGKQTYLELAFPRYGSERDYKRFFRSPRIVAATSNKFVGVFLVSFEEWGGSNELLREEAFGQLLNFIDANTKNISFVFHVLPEFTDAHRLMDILSLHTNLLRVELRQPDLRAAVEYVVHSLKDSGMELSQEAKRQLCGFMEKNVDRDSKTFEGFHTLERLARNICFELCVMSDERGREIHEVSVDEIRRLSLCMNFPEESNYREHRLGFR